MHQDVVQYSRKVSAVSAPRTQADDKTYVSCFVRRIVSYTMNKTKESLDEESAQLEWIQLRDDMGFEALKHEESAKDKLKRKFAENPFVPVGCGLTAAALSYGLWSFRQG